MDDPACSSVPSGWPRDFDDFVELMGPKPWRNSRYDWSKGTKEMLS